MVFLKQAILGKEKTNSAELTKSDFHAIQSKEFTVRRKTKQTLSGPGLQL